jgi:hypothetical protein
MSQRTNSSTNQRFLPFSVLSENRGVPFTPDLEAATIFTLTEFERGKGGGLILKQPEEKIKFIAKLGYPVWVSPWRGIALAFDGLTQTSCTQPYLSVPDVTGFVENLKRGARTLETHQAFLSDHLNYFQAPAAEKTLVVNGLMTDAQFMTEFNLCRRGAEGADTEAAEIGLIPPLLDEPAVASGIRDLETLRETLQANANNLYKGISFLHKTTQQYVKELHGNTAEVKAEFAAKIQQEEKIVAPKVAQLRDDYDFRMNSMAKSYEKRRLPIQQAKTRLEKSHEHATARLEQYKAEAKAHADKGHAASEQKWKEKASETRKELKETEKQLKQTEKALKDLEELRSVETIKLRDELETQIREARKNLLELEAHRDAKILIHNQETEKLETQTKMICDQLSSTAKLLETNVAQLDKLGVERELGLNGILLYYVPFYVACFQADSQKRFMVTPPSIVNNVGVFTKLKGALRMSKINSILTPRFKTVSALVESVHPLAQKNAAFETELTELGMRNNVLATPCMSGNIRDGLKGLRDEGWLSEKEFDDVLKRIN